MTQTSFLHVCVCQSFLPFTEYSLNKETFAGTLKWGALLSTDNGEKNQVLIQMYTVQHAGSLQKTAQRLVAGRP